MSDTIITSPTGAKSSVEPDYTHLPTAGLLKAIERFENGMPKYGRDNWRKGLNDPAYLQGRLAHAIGHLFLLRDALQKLERNESLTAKELDDHVGAVLWFGFFAACHHQVQVLDTERAVQEVSRHQRPSYLAMAKAGAERRRAERTATEPVVKYDEQPEPVQTHLTVNPQHEFVKHDSGEECLLCGYSESYHP